MKRVWLWITSAVLSEIHFHVKRALHPAPDEQQARVIAFALAKTNRLDLR